MKKTILIGLLALALPSIGFGEEEKENDFFDSVIGTRIEECKGHFDIVPYFNIAIGADQDKESMPEVAKSLENFGETGKISLTEAQAKDPIAVSCATYAEGVLAGGIGSQLVSGLSQALGNAIAEGVSTVFEEVVNGIGEAVSQSVEGQIPEKK